MDKSPVYTASRTGVAFLLAIALLVQASPALAQERLPGESLRFRDGSERVSSLLRVVEVSENSAILQYIVRCEAGFVTLGNPFGNAEEPNPVGLRLIDRNGAVLGSIRTAATSSAGIKTRVPLGCGHCIGATIKLGRDELNQSRGHRLQAVFPAWFPRSHRDFPLDSPASDVSMASNAVSLTPTLTSQAVADEKQSGGVNVRIELADDTVAPEDHAGIWVEVEHQHELRLQSPLLKASNGRSIDITIDPVNGQLARTINFGDSVSRISSHPTQWQRLPRGAITGAMIILPPPIQLVKAGSTHGSKDGRRVRVSAYVRLIGRDPADNRVTTAGKSGIIDCSILNE